MDTNTLMRNALMMRQAWLQKWMDPRRDIEAECGHPQVVNIGDCAALFRRGDVAGRVISIYPEETWNQPPMVFETEDETETEFEKGWEAINRRLHLVAYLQRIDILSGIGRFGVLLLGLDDGVSLDRPVQGINARGEIEPGEREHQLLYLRPLDETLVTVKTLEPDVTNPRYGLPLTYEVQFADSVLGDQATTNKQVHWSRVIHVADNRTNSEVFGTPRLERVLNRVLDLRKIAGGSAEMFWKGAFPGLSLQSHPNLSEDIEFDKAGTKAEMEAYMNGLQRYIATIGMDVKSLSVQIADPRPHVETQMRMIATALAVPWRIFLGSEQSQLASQEDTAAWNTRITRRREDYINPFLLRPFVDRLIAVGALPPPAKAEEGYQIWWPDPHTPSDEEKATVAEKQSNALAKYVQSGSDAMVDPFHYLTLVLGMEADEAKSIIEAAEKRMAEMPDEPDDDDEEAVAPPNPRFQRNGENL